MRPPFAAAATAVPAPCCTQIDTFDSEVVYAFVTPGNYQMLLAHPKHVGDEESVKNFFTQVSERASERTSAYLLSVVRSFVRPSIRSFVRRFVRSLVRSLCRSSARS